MNKDYIIKTCNELSNDKFYQMIVKQILNIKEYSNCYEETELYLILNGFELINVVRDSRGDWGDDGGYLISLSKKNDFYYLHIFAINYNGEVKTHWIEDDSFPNDDGGFKDFIKSDNLEVIDKYIHRFIKCLNENIEIISEEGLYDIDDIKTHCKDIPDDILPYIGLMESSYSEYKKIDEKRILNITKVDMSEYWKHISNSLKVQQEYIKSNIESIWYRIQNPELFKLINSEIRRIVDYLHRSKYDIDCKRVFNMESDIEQLLMGMGNVIHIDTNHFESGYVRGKCCFMTDKDIKKLPHGEFVFTIKDIILASFYSLESLNRT